MRKRIIRRMRKEIMRLGTIISVEALKRDDDGTLCPKKDRGAYVEAIVNGWRICSADNNWYMAYKGCLEAAKMCAKKEPGPWDEKTRTRREE